MGFLFDTDSADVITDVNKISDTDAIGVTKLPTFEAIQDDSYIDVLEADEQTEEPATKTNSLFMTLNSFNEEEIELGQENDDVSANVRNFKLCGIDMTIDIIPKLEEIMINFFS